MPFKSFNPIFNMHFYDVCSVVHHFNRVFGLGGGSRFVVLKCLLMFFLVIIVLGLFYIIVVLFCNC